MFNQAGRQVGVTIPEGQGQDRIEEPNKVLFVGKPLELRPLQYSDEYGRVHMTVVYVTKDAPGDVVYFYQPTEEAVKGWRQATKRIKDQVLAWFAREHVEVPQQDTVDVVAQDVVETRPELRPIDVVPVKQHEDPKASQ